MFNAAKVVTFGAVLVGLSVATAQAGKQDFEFVNLNRSASIVGAWMAGAGTTGAWEPVTIYKPIAPRTSGRITINGDKRCAFDIKVRFDDGVEQTFDDIDLCTTNKVIAD